MKTTQIRNLVSYLLGLFDTLVLLVAWPLGKKGCKGVDFTKGRKRGSHLHIPQ